MSQLAIHSRPGNVTLAATGIVIVIASLALFVFFLATTIDGASITERILQLGLLLCAAGGVFLTRVGTHNLGIDLHALRRH
jgi:hypothetical protein